MGKNNDVILQSLPVLEKDLDISRWASAPWGWVASTLEGLHAAFSRGRRQLCAHLLCITSKKAKKPAMCEHSHGYSNLLSFWGREKDAQLHQAGGGYRLLLAGDAGAIQRWGLLCSLPAQLKLRSIPSPLLPFLRAAAFLCYFPLGLQFFPVSHRQYIKHILLKFFQQKLHWNNF